MCKIQPVVLMILLVTALSSRFADPTQRFNGIAQLVFETSNLTLRITMDVMEEVEASLKDVLFGSVVDLEIERVVDHNVSALKNLTITVLFQGSTDNFRVIPACLSGQTFQLAGNVQAKYEITALSLQTFEGTRDMEQQCQADGLKIIYIEHHEDGCQFNQLDCETSEGTRTYRFDLYERDSVLYSFFCYQFVSECDIDWAGCTWQPSCELTMTSCMSYPFEDIIPISSYKRLDTGIRTLSDPSMSSNNADITRVGPPVVKVHGDVTWDLLPEWLKVGIRVLNAVSLTTIVFCLVTYATFRELRNAHSRNVMSLLVAVLMSQVYTSEYIPLQTENRPVCVFIATLLYYVVILPNYWWASMAIFLAWTLGRKGIHRMDEESSSRLFLLLSLLGWGVPLVFSLITLCLHIGGITAFDVDDSCWIIDGWPTIVLMIQAAVPFVLNCVLFALVTHRLRMTRQELTTLQSKPAERNDRQLTMKLTAVFGVFWLPAWVVYISFLILPVKSLAIASQLLNQLSAFILPGVLACNQRVWRLWKARLSPLGVRIRSFTARTHATRTSSRDETVAVGRSSDGISVIASKSYHSSQEKQRAETMETIDNSHMRLTSIHDGGGEK